MARSPVERARGRRRAAPEDIAAVRAAFAHVLALQLGRRPRRRFAAEAKISRAHLYRLLAAKDQPSVTVMLSIAQALPLHPMELLHLLLEALAAARGNPPPAQPQEGARDRA
jgi:DNA-binding phage protein